jgi:hypothetical protein
VTVVSSEGGTLRVITASGQPSNVIVLTASGSPQAILSDSLALVAAYQAAPARTPAKPS